MKVAHVVQRYTPGPLTGSEKAMVILSESLAAKSDLDITVLTSNVLKGEGFYDPFSPRITNKRERVNGVTVVRLPLNWFKASLLYILNRFLPLLNGPTNGQLKFMAFGPQLIGLDQCLVVEKVALIHACPLPMSHVYTAWRAARSLGLPFVVTPTLHVGDPAFEYSAVNNVMTDADQLIAHTEFEKKELIERGVAAERISVIASSFLHESDFTVADDTQFRARYDLKDYPYILFIGSKSLDKGTIDLLAAWPAVLKKVPEARLVIGGVSTQSWIEYKKSADLTQVIELEYVEDSEKSAALSGCVALAIPSRTESFGMVLLEAWAKAKPVIGGPAGATRELVEEGVNGYTVEFGDRKTLSDRINKLLTDRDLCNKLGKAGLAKAKQFSETVIVADTLAVYERAIKINDQRDK